MEFHPSTIPQTEPLIFVPDSDIAMIDGYNRIRGKAIKIYNYVENIRCKIWVWKGDFPMTLRNEENMQRLGSNWVYTSENILNERTYL